MMRISGFAAFALALLAGAPAFAQQQRSQPAPKPSAETNKPASRGGFGQFGENNKQPINIEADKLDVFQKENKAVYAGNVYAVQGDTTMRCSTLTVFFESRDNNNNSNKAAGAPKATTQAPANGGSQAPGQPPGESSVKRLECKGPVTVTSKDQTATANEAVYDRVVGKVFLIGNAVMSQGPNVTAGERVTYDVNTGIASVEPGAASGRVRGVFVPGSENKDEDKAKEKPNQGKAKTKPSASAATN